MLWDLVGVLVQDLGVRKTRGQGSMHIEVCALTLCLDLRIRLRDIRQRAYPFGS